MTLNRSEIFTTAWANFRFFQSVGIPATFVDCLKRSWADYKVRAALDIAAENVSCAEPPFVMEYRERGSDAWTTGQKFWNECDAYERKSKDERYYFDRTYRVRAA